MSTIIFIYSLIIIIIIDFYGAYILRNLSSEARQNRISKCNRKQGRAKVSICYICGCVYIHIYYLLESSYFFADYINNYISLDEAEYLFWRNPCVPDMLVVFVLRKSFDAEVLSVFKKMYAASLNKCGTKDDGDVSLLTRCQHLLGVLTNIEKEYRKLPTTYHPG